MPGTNTPPAASGLNVCDEQQYILQQAYESDVLEIEHSLALFLYSRILSLIKQVPHVLASYGTMGHTRMDHQTDSLGYSLRILMSNCFWPGVNYVEAPTTLVISGHSWDCMDNHLAVHL